MNDQSQMMNQPPPPQMMMNPVQVQPQLMAHSATPMGLSVPPMAQSQPMMNQPPPMMMNRNYKPWPQDPNLNSNKMFSSLKPNYNRNSNWKGKKITGNVNLPDNKRKDGRKFDKFDKFEKATAPVIAQGYKPPTLNELQSQNRLKARKFYGNKKKFNNNNRFAPYAPRNTTSFIIRAKKAGGIAELVSPCPVTPAVLPTPIFSPSREVLGDMAKEEWGVDGYGSMKGLIRLRSSPGHNEAEIVHDDDEEDEGSSESDVEEHVEVERRLDHDLSRFEMIYPSYGGDYNNVLENRVDDQDTHIAQLEEENLTLKERLFLMERELGDLRRRLQYLERQNQLAEDVNEEVVENGSDNENESEGGGSDVRVAANDTNNKMIEILTGNEGRGEVNSGRFHTAVKVEQQNVAVGEIKGRGDVCMEELVPEEVEPKERGSGDEGRPDDEVNSEVAGSKFVREGVLGAKKEADEAEALGAAETQCPVDLINAVESQVVKADGNGAEEDRLLMDDMIAEKEMDEVKREAAGTECADKLMLDEDGP